MLSNWNNASMYLWSLTLCVVSCSLVYSADAEPHKGSETVPHGVRPPAHPGVPVARDPSDTSTVAIASSSSQTTVTPPSPARDRTVSIETTRAPAGGTSSNKGLVIAGIPQKPDTTFVLTWENSNDGILYYFTVNNGYAFGLWKGIVGEDAEGKPEEIKEFKAVLNTACIHITYVLSKFSRFSKEIIPLKPLVNLYISAMLEESLETIPGTDIKHIPLPTEYIESEDETLNEYFRILADLIVS